MGASTVPAAGGASAADWTFIATAAPSAVTSATFTGISGYKKLKLVGFLTNGSTQNFLVAFNSDFTSPNYRSVATGLNIFMTDVVDGTNATTGIICMTADVNNGFFNLEINNATLTTVYKDTVGTSSGSTGGGPATGGTSTGVWKNTAAITTIAVTGGAGATFTGNLYLMGQN
jgi:hypothetical protein